jgi:hypothetical protein
MVKTSGARTGCLPSPGSGTSWGIFKVFTWIGTTSGYRMDRTHRAALLSSPKGTRRPPCAVTRRCGRWTTDGGLRHGIVGASPRERTYARCAHVPGYRC